MKVEDAVSDDADAPSAPGRLASHYATRAKIRLNAEEVNAGEALLAFGKTLPRGAGQAKLTLNLSESGDLVEAAANLYAHLRALDEARPAAIAVASIPREGMGEAIEDRLLRAAAPRA
jgi:L-threonylcarbamoyladenylate synthase